MSDAKKKTDDAKVADLKKPYAVWQIGDEEYRLKLTTASIMDLEDQYHCNLIDLLNQGGNSNAIPPLTQMLDVVHAALQKYHHGIKKSDMSELFDDFVEAGGSQMGLYLVYIEIFTVSGFFSETAAGEMREALMDSDITRLV